MSFAISSYAYMSIHQVQSPDSEFVKIATKFGSNIHEDLVAIIRSVLSTCLVILSNQKKDDDFQVCQRVLFALSKESGSYT